MWKVLVNSVEILIYAAVFIILSLVAAKIAGATFTTDFEKKIADENNIALAIIVASLFIGLSIIVASIAG
ncbi:MAG: DUF350 domain-containing protein [Syntrophorhabdaceae bacterium]|nr:DUF350 domain-containing protein [Syntrophorhabdaceae bacterium]MDD4196178.1 DUF350 domain-containing protein [Syntrophorhabdaceae bacterium]